MPVRSPLLHAIIQVCRRTAAGLHANAQSESRKLSRHDFLKTSIASVAAITLAGNIGACTRANDNNPKTVAIVGAGMAGLSAAHALRKAGITPIVYEAGSRAGGRIMSGNNLMGEGLVTEFGGEFLNSNHTDMLALCDEFGLEKLDMEKDTAPLKTELFFVKGRPITNEELATEFKKILPQLQADFKLCQEENSARLREIDALSIDEYLSGYGVKGWFFDLLKTTFEAEYGIDTADQSALNFLYLVGLDVSNGFSMLGDSDERYKVKGGNQKLTEAIASSLTPNILYRHEVKKISKVGTEYLISFADGSTAQTDFIIMTLPFSVLRKVQLEVEISPRKRRAIDTLGYGTNSKIMFGVENRIWRRQGESGYLFSDVAQGWDNSRMQNSNEGRGGFTLFVGGRNGAEVGAAFIEQSKQMLDQAFPGFSSQHSGTPTIFNWSVFPYSLGSFACYKKGQWTDIAGCEGEPEGNMYFAGDHCSQEFLGFMNGAASSGRIAAQNIIKAINCKSC